MNGRDRFGALLSGQPVDRRPFAPVLSLYGARLTYHDARSYYTDPKAYVAGQRAVMDLVEPDVLFAPFALSVEGAAFGGDEHFLPRHAPNLRAPVIRSARDIARVRRPDVATHPRLQYVREALRRLRDAEGHRAMLCGICLSPVDSASLLLGMEGWMEALLFDPAGARAVLDLTTSFFVDWACALLADGADFLALPVAFANPVTVTPDMLRATILPVLRDAFAQVPGPILFHHAGGPIGPFLPLLLDLPNVAGFALDSRDDLSKARQIVGPGKLLMGNVDGPSLASATPDEVRALAEAALRAVGDDPLFVLATASADVPWETPPANILALREAVSPTSGVTLCACSVFRDDITAVDWGEKPRRTIYLDSALHVDPHELDDLVGSVIDFERSCGRRVLVAYGDCAPHLDERCRQGGCARIASQNCCAAVAGRDGFRRLRRGDAFLFMPEWAGRWRELLAKAVGGDERMMRESVTDQNERIVFLVRPGQPSPQTCIDEVAGFFGLPVSVEVVPETGFAEALLEASVKLRAARE